MTRTNKRRERVTSIRTLARTIGGDHLKDLGNLYYLVDYPHQGDALRVAIEREFRRLGGHKEKQADDQADVRMFATLNVGYRLGLVMASELAGGGR